MTDFDVVTGPGPAALPKQVPPRPQEMPPRPRSEPPAERPASIPPPQR